MNVSEVCSRSTAACRPGMTLAEAAALFRHHGTDALPVVDARGRVLGILSERDLARGLGRARPEADLRAGLLMDRELATCYPSDEVRQVLPLMGLLSAGRLPVVDERHLLWGVLRIEDILCQALAEGGSRDLPAAEVLDAFCQITRRERPGLSAVRVSRAPLGRSA